MNQSNSNFTANLLVSNVALQKTLIPAFFLWLVLCVSNALCSIWIICVLTVFKAMKKDVRLLVVHMTLTELFGAVGTTVAAVYHLVCAYTETPETNSPLRCYSFNAANVFGEIASAEFYLLLSVDRFFAAVFPTTYRNRKQSVVRVAVAFCWTFSFAYFLSSFFYLKPSPYIALCLLILEISEGFFSFHTYVVTFLGLFSLLIYASEILWLKCNLCCRVATVTAAHSSGANNLSEIEKRMKSKVTRALAVNASFHLITSSLAAFGATVLIWLGFYTVNFGPYFAPLFHVGSLIELPIFYVYQKKFRLGSNALIKCIVTLRRPTVVSNIH